MSIMLLSSSCIRKSMVLLENLISKIWQNELGRIMLSNSGINYLQETVHLASMPLKRATVELEPCEAAQIAVAAVQALKRTTAINKGNKIGDTVNLSVLEDNKVNFILETIKIPPHIQRTVVIVMAFVPFAIAPIMMRHNAGGG